MMGEDEALPVDDAGAAEKENSPIEGVDEIVAEPNGFDEPNGLLVVVVEDDANGLVKGLAGADLSSSFFTTSVELKTNGLLALVEVVDDDDDDDEEPNTNDGAAEEEDDVVPNEALEPNANAGVGLDELLLVDEKLNGFDFTSADVELLLDEVPNANADEVTAPESLLALNTNGAEETVLVEVAADEEESPVVLVELLEPKLNVFEVADELLEEEDEEPKVNGDDVEAEVDDEPNEELEPNVTGLSSLASLFVDADEPNVKDGTDEDDDEDDDEAEPNETPNEADDDDGADDDPPPKLNTGTPNVVLGASALTCSSQPGFGVSHAAHLIKSGLFCTKHTSHSHEDDDG